MTDRIHALNTAEKLLFGDRISNFQANVLEDLYNKGIQAGRQDRPEPEMNVLAFTRREPGIQSAEAEAARIYGRGIEGA